MSSPPATSTARMPASAVPGEGDAKCEWWAGEVKVVEGHARHQHGQDARQRGASTAGRGVGQHGVVWERWGRVLPSTPCHPATTSTPHRPCSSQTACQPTVEQRVVGVVWVEGHQSLAHVDQALHSGKEKAC